MKLPNFILAGFPKCGSTSLYYYLFEHPEIFLPKQKELHYFTYDILTGLNAGKGDKEIQEFHIGSFEKYKACFSGLTTEKAIGDVSPSYANYKDCIPNIKNTLGKNTKIIFILRDPVQRAYSNYLHLVRENREKLTFYEALMQEDKRREDGYSDFWYYFFNSTYLPKINRMKEYFKDVLIITFEEFINDSQKGIKEIYSFLGVDVTFKPGNLNTKFNAGGVYDDNAITRFIFSQNRLKNMIKKTIPISMGMKKTKLWLIEKYKKETPNIPQDAKSFLVDKFRQDLEELKALGIKTELWNNSFDLIMKDK